MTNDFLEDACDMLDKDERPWILFVGDGRATRVLSNMGADNLTMLEGWIEEGHWNEMLRQHIEIVRLR